MLLESILQAVFMVLPGTVVAIAVLAALFSANELGRTRRKIARLEKLKIDGYIHPAASSFLKFRRYRSDQR